MCLYAAVCVCERKTHENKTEVPQQSIQVLENEKRLMEANNQKLLKRIERHVAKNHQLKCAHNNLASCIRICSKTLISASMCIR